MRYSELRDTFKSQMFDRLPVKLREEMNRINKLKRMASENGHLGES